MRIFQAGGDIPKKESRNQNANVINAVSSGPWAVQCNGSNISIPQGHVFDGNFKPITISNIGSSFSIGAGTNYIKLKIDLNGGSVTSASIELSSSSEVIYREWSGKEKSIDTQTSLSALIAAISFDDKPFDGMSDVYYGSTARYKIYRCLYNDLMLYQDCNGLILLPAPFSLP